MGEKFEYTYSAKEREEIERIREKYAPNPGQDKLEQLRKLDASTTKGATAVSIVVGIIGTLLLGVSMCCTMVWTDRFFIVGIVVGVLGIIGVASALPVYNRMVKKRREQVAQEVLRLTDELSQQ